MTQDLHTRIHAELLVFLGREPSENEIQNGQTDVNIISKVKDKQSAEKEATMQATIDTLSSQVSKLPNAIITTP